MKYRFVTLGCKVNTYESEAVKKLLDEKGYVPAEKENPDVIVINTCSVTSVSDQKCRQKIRSEIRKFPSSIVVVMGCYSQMESDFVASIPGVSVVLGTSNRHLIPELIEQYQQSHQTICIVEKKRDVPYEGLSVTSYTENTRAYLKIQDGCDNFCTYCIIPYARGKMRSRKQEEVLLEVKELLDAGFREIVLTGIHTGGYGKDIGTSFPALVKKILEDQRLYRLRISSIEESEIDEELLSLLQGSVLAHHFHIPLQSGSARVLKDMHRKYSKEQFLGKLQRIREAIPNVAITTDIIVGFPGETEEEFVETMEFAKVCQFAKIHVFPYSPRAGTPAANRPDQVDPSVKKERVHRLLSLSQKLENAYQSLFIGQEVEVLFEEYDESIHLWKGHTSNYLEVYAHFDENVHNCVRKVVYEKNVRYVMDGQEAEKKEKTKI